MKFFLINFSVTKFWCLFTLFYNIQKKNYYFICLLLCDFFDTLLTCSFHLRSCFYIYFFHILFLLPFSSSDGFLYCFFPIFFQIFFIFYIIFSSFFFTATIKIPAFCFLKQFFSIKKFSNSFLYEQKNELWQIIFN